MQHEVQADVKDGQGCLLIPMMTNELIVILQLFFNINGMPPTVPAEKSFCTLLILAAR